MADDERDGIKDLRNATGNVESLPPYPGLPGRTPGLRVRPRTVC
jgi:hypothetical protein